MPEVIIHQDPEPIFAILGRDGERWTKGWGDYSADEPTGTCLHGALRRCCPVRGDAYLIEQVGARLGFGVAFNDADGWDPVCDRIAQGFDITDEMLEITFGPQWRAIARIVRQAASATPKQMRRLAAAWAAARAPAANDAARAAALAAANAAAWAAAWAAANDAARAAAANDAVRDAANDAAMAAARAACIYDLIGQHDFTRRHYDTLIGPWLSVFGDPMEEPKE